MNIKRVILTGLLAFALAFSLNAQSITTPISAIDFAYGIGNVAPLRVIGGPYAAGVATITVSQGYAVSASGITFNPLSTSALIRVGSGTSQESITPSAVSCSTPAVYGTCSFTATLANTHGTGDLVMSATYGAQEAVNYQAAQPGGGVIKLNSFWARAGGTDAIISALVPSSRVAIRDDRTPMRNWSMQPTTASLIAAPVALTVATVTQPATCPTGGTCTWTAAQPFFRIAYVDALGGISAASTAYQPGVNLTASVPVNIASPAASTGAVGWIAFAGTTSPLSYMLPIVTTAGVANGACTLTTLESAIPACAIGSAASFNTVYVNTNMLAPVATQSTANVHNPVFQAHTTFAYQPTGSMPTPFQSHFGPFPANTASAASANVAHLGAVALPTGYLNYIGRTIRVRGKVAATAVTAGIPTVVVALGWQAGFGAGTGAPTTICTLAGVAVTAGTAVLQPFDCVITTTAAASTAVGSVVTEGFTIANAATTAATPGTDAGTGTPVGSLALFGPTSLFITWTDNGQAYTAAQLVDLHIETLQ